MSADNGIYIAEFPDGWRVVETQNIEDCYDSPKYSSKLTAAVVSLTFGGHKVFDSEEDAVQEATRIYKEIMDSEFPVLEYGISFIGKYEFVPYSKDEATRIYNEEWAKIKG